MNTGIGARAIEKGPDSLRALQDRLARLEPSRLSDAVSLFADHFHQIVETLGPTPLELRALIEFLTETGHHADARRQEWLLLADVIGVSRAVHDRDRRVQDGITPHTACGPFYRSDAPEIGLGQSLCRDGRGEPMLVSGSIRSSDGRGLGGASIEVWHANGEGFYENQQPDLQPEHNLRGRLVADDNGLFAFSTVKPGGYSLPVDGPVGRLLTRIGLPHRRPAHINLRVSAPGYQTLTTQIFDRADPAVDQDAIFGVKPELLADIRNLENEGQVVHALDINLVLASSAPAQPIQGRN